MANSIFMHIFGLLTSTLSGKKYIALCFCISPSFPFSHELVQTIFIAVSQTDRQTDTDRQTKCVYVCASLGLYVCQASTPP